MGTWVGNPPQESVGTLSYNLVTDRFDTTQQYAIEAYNATQQFSNDLQSLIAGLEIPESDSLDVNAPVVDSLDFSDRPLFGNLALPSDWPVSVPSKPGLEPVPELKSVTIPIFSLETPVYNMPDEPVVETLQPPGDSPVVNFPDTPMAPDVVLPSAPILYDISFPEAPMVSIPEFEGVLPEDVLVVPEDFNWQESPYNSDVWNDLLRNVLDGLRNGGTGLDADVEQEIFDRAIDRQQVENDRTYQEIEDKFSNFDFPPGVLAGALLETSQQISRNNTDLNGKITIEQAELAQKNTHFILEKGITVEQLSMDFHNAQENRSLEASKAAAQFGIEVFNSSVARYNAKLERYKAEGAVFESRVKAVLTTIEIYKSQVEAAKVESDVQKNLVDIYEKQIAAVETTVRMYSVQMESVKIAADVERLKIEAFGQQIQLYVSRLEAQKTQYDIYGKKVDAETTKAQLYSEQVKAFVSEVEASKTLISAEALKLDSVIKSNGILIDGYKAELSGYVAEIDATAKKTDAVVEGFKAEVAGYSAETGAKGMEYGAKIKEIEARISESRFYLQKAIADVDAATKGYVAIKGLQVQGTESVMNVGAQMTSSMWSAVNASATLGSSTGATESHSYGHSEGITESHGYSHE